MFEFSDSAEHLLYSKTFAQHGLTGKFRATSSVGDQSLTRTVPTKPAKGVLSLEDRRTVTSPNHLKRFSKHIRRHGLTWIHHESHIWCLSLIGINRCAMYGM